MELDKYLDMYAEKFGEGFPMIPLAWGREDDEIIELIQECLDKEQDVYQLGYVVTNGEIKY